MTNRTYSRRRFMQVAGLAVGAVVLAPVVAEIVVGTSVVYAEALGKQYKGTRDGRVYESSDAGKTWQQVAYFGSHCAVMALADRHDRLQAEIGVAGYGFALTTTDARVWRTV